MQKPTECQGCPMYDDGEGFVPDEIVPNSPLSIFLQNPGGSEEIGYLDAQGTRRFKPAIGPTGEKLDGTFIPLSGLRRGEVSVHNVIRCRWRNPHTGLKSNDLPSATGVWNKNKWDKGAGAKLEAQAAQHCRVHDHIPDTTKLIVACGDTAWRGLGQTGTIADWRGFIGLDSTPEKPHQIKYFRGLPVLGTYHPAYLMHQPRMTIPVMHDWKRVGAYLKGAWPKPIPMVNKGSTIPAEPPDGTLYVVIDTEYVPETYDVTMFSVLYYGVGPEPVYGVQIPRGDLAYQLTRQRLLKLISVHFNGIPVVGHNVIAELLAFNKLFGFTEKDYAQLEDTIQLHALLQSEWPHDLGFVESLHGRHHRMKHLWDTAPDLYNWGDCLTTGYAFQDMMRQLNKDPQTMQVYRGQNIPLIPIRYQAKKVGMGLDGTFLAKTSKDLVDRITAARHVAEGFTGLPFNIGSHEQFTTWLTKVEKIKLKKKKHSPGLSADKDAVAELRRLYWEFDPTTELDGITPDMLEANIHSGGHPLIEARAAYQSATQLYAHYIKPLLKEDHDDTIRAYAPDDFKTWVSADQHTHTQASGRWSTQSPPFPTFPKKLRKAIVPPPGYCLVKYDADQQELRLNAHLANDLPTLEAFEHGWDIHTLNTCDIFMAPVPPERRDPHTSSLCEVWRTQLHWEGKDDKRRVFSKRFVYRLIYRGDPRFAHDIPGAKAMGLTGPKLAEASQNYLHAHPALVAHWAKLDAQVRATRTVRSFYGRKRYLNGTFEARPGQVAAPFREGTNHPIQSGGVDWCNLLILALYHESQDLGVVWGFGAHDSHNWLVPLGNEQAFVERIGEVTRRPWMVEGRPLIIPVTLDPIIYPLT